MTFVKSMIRVTVLSMGLACGFAAKAHEIQPAIADVEVFDDRVEISLRMALESLVAGINLEGLDNANNAPEAALYDAFRYMPPEEFEAALREAWPRIAQGFVIESGGRYVLPGIEFVAIPAVGNIEFARDSVITLSANLPEGDAPVVIGWRPSYGILVLREVSDDDNAYEAFLTAGDLSDPLPRPGSGDGFWNWLFGWL